MAREWHDTHILEVVQETGIDRSFHLERPAGDAFDFLPGQFVIVVDPEAEQPVRRAYSLSSAPSDDSPLVVTVRNMGGFGHDFYEFPTGKALRMQEPQGRFVLAPEPGDQLVFVAGGSGVTPFRSFVRHLGATGSECPAILLQSARQADQLLFREEFEARAAAQDLFRYVPSVTRAADDDPWAGLRGRIDEALLAETIEDPAKTRFYACGPGAFVRAMLAAAQALGVAKERCRKEQWG